MSQIQYTYPAMLAHADTMDGHAGALHSVGSGVASEQAALAATYNGDTATQYQSWQQQWNAAHEQLVSSYRTMADTLRNGTMQMHGRDSAEGAKWV